MRNPTAQDWQQLERLQEEILAKRLRGLVARWPVERRVSEAQRRAWRQELHSLRAAIDGDATDEDGGDMDRPRLKWTASTAGRHSATGPNGVIGRVRPASASSGISRPFDARRDGFVMSEGAGALVLEEWDRAVARGAHIYAEVAGAGSTADAHHITAPAPDGSGAVACMEQALFDAGLQPGDIVHINAHGTSTPLNDLSEATAIAKVFGEPGPIVTSTKGVTGHALGGAGAIEAVAASLTIDRRLIPPTYGCEELDPEIHLDVVQGAARPWEPGPVLSNSFGFGGHNGCLIVIPPD